VPYRLRSSIEKEINIKKFKFKRSAHKVRETEQDQPNELWHLQKKVFFGLGLSFLGIAIIVAALLWPDSKSQTSANPSTGSSITDVCSEKNTITYSCYKNELTQITNQQGPEKAMALVKQAYTKVPYVKSQCHQLTHAIGRAALTKYGNVADTYAHGDQFCWSGYYHGAMEQLANEKGYDYTIKNANNICKPVAAKGEYSFYHYNCVHGLGHGFMFVKDGDLFAALGACDTLTNDWERTSCYGGVFMQNIMNEQSPDDDNKTGSKYLKADQPMYPCTAIDYKYKDQCYLMQTSYALQTASYDFSKVFSMCDNTEATFRDTCYTSLGRDASGNSISNVDKTRSTCLLGTTDEARRYCVHGAAMDFVSYFHSDKQAKQLCQSLPDSLSADCLGVVKNYYASF
jgi:hypothetical protein